MRIGTREPLEGGPIINAIGEQSRHASGDKEDATPLIANTFDQVLQQLSPLITTTFTTYYNNFSATYERHMQTSLET